jgi:hypothetical protein
MRTHTSTISLSNILFYITIMKKQTANTISLNHTESQNTCVVEGEQHMTSVEIAELTGKQHCHVMEAIRKMEPAWEKIAESNFRLGSYMDAKRARTSLLLADQDRVPLHRHEVQRQGARISQKRFGRLSGHNGPERL